jgi:predicted Zn-dependent peptidase
MNALASRKKLKGIPVEYRDIPVTPERLMRSIGEIDVGDDKQGNRIYTFKDSPLQRMFSRKAIDPTEYTALQKYFHHWYHGGLLPGVGSVDLNRVFASDPGLASGMAKSERQAHHRQQYRAARAEIGHRAGVVVDNVVCHENSLEVGGFSIGWTNKPQAIAAATEMLRDAGCRLAKLWGIG